MDKGKFTRILVKSEGLLLRLCSLHLHLGKKQLYLQFKSKAGKPFTISQQGIGKIDYREGSIVVQKTSPIISGISRVHYVIESNEVLLTHQKRGVQKEHTPKVKLQDKKIVRFCTFIPNLQDLPAHNKQVSKLDFIFEKTKLFSNKPIYVDFWFGKNLGEEEQQKLQMTLRSKYMSDTGRICEVLGGYTQNFDIIIAFYQPINAPRLQTTRIMIPSPTDTT